MYWSPHCCGCRQVEDIASCDFLALPQHLVIEDTSCRESRSRNLRCLIPEWVKKNTGQGTLSKIRQDHNDLIGKGFQVTEASVAIELKLPTG
jgi:hypothetical protein